MEIPLAPARERSALQNRLGMVLVYWDLGRYHSWDDACDSLVEDLVEGLFTVEQFSAEMPPWSSIERTTEFFRRLIDKAHANQLEAMRYVALGHEPTINAALDVGLIDLEFLSRQPQLELFVLFAAYRRRGERPELFTELERELELVGTFLDASKVSGWGPIVRNGESRDPRVVALRWADSIWTWRAAVGV
jgi:hypothetical protein